MSAAAGDQTNNPIVIQQKQSSKRSISDTYKTTAAKVLGVIHLLCGVVALGTGIGNIFNAYSGHAAFHGGTGIWTSVFFFVTGGLSIGSGTSANSCLVIGTLVMSIFSAICGGILLIINSISLGVESYYFSYQWSAVCLGLQIVVGLTQLVLAVVSSALACHATCCRPKVDPEPGNQMVYTSPESGDITQHGQIQGGLLGRQILQTSENGPESTGFMYQKLIE